MHACHHSRRLIVKAMGLAPLASIIPATAQAAWPNKPLRLVVGFAPGGGTDVGARALSQPLSRSLGQPVIVDNRPGAGGNLSSAAVAHAAADGHTFLAAPTTLISANPYLYKMNFNPAKELIAGPALGRFQLYLVTRAGLGVKSLEELLAMARANPGKLSYASSGPGTLPHLIMELFLKQAGIKVVHVPYRGSALVVQAVLGGEADFGIDPGMSFPHARAGKLKMLSLLSAKRSVQFPEVPTFIEAGFPSMEYDGWLGMWAPAGTPPDVLQKISHAIESAVSLPAVREKFTMLGAEALYLDPAAFGKIVQRESNTFSALIQELKLTIS